jgi:regulation of enolase protein 1 (concanavalin A-like superfamily)
LPKVAGSMADRNKRCIAERKWAMTVRLCVTIMFLLTLALVLVSASSAQSDPCSVAAVLASFEAAALSNNVDVWLERYQDSNCSETILRGARQLAGSYSTLSGERIVGGTIATGTSLIPHPDDPTRLNPALRWIIGHSPVNRWLYDPISEALTIMSVRGSTLWQRTNNAPMMQYSVTGDFIAQVRLDFNPDGQSYKVAGMVFISPASPTTWHRLDFSQEENRHQIGSNFAVDGAMQRTGSVARFGDYTIYLRVTRSGNRFSSEYSGDGQDWRALTTNVSLSLPDRINIGLFVESNMPMGAVARFSEFTVTPLEDN